MPSSHEYQLRREDAGIQFASIPTGGSSMPLAAVPIQAASWHGRPLSVRPKQGEAHTEKRQSPISLFDAVLPCPSRSPRVSLLGVCGRSSGVYR